MKRTRKLATVAMAAVLGIIITTTTTIGTGIFLQQANASNCHIHEGGNSGCSNDNSFRSSQFNYQGKDDPGKPYLYHEHHGDSDDDNDRGHGNDKNDNDNNNDDD